MTLSATAILSGSDWFGFGLMLPIGLFILWFFNWWLRSADTLASLFTDWPLIRPTEFRVWLGLAVVITFGVCLLLNTETQTIRLARRHATTFGTFEKYEGNHAEFRYAFVVQGQQYHGNDSSDEHKLQDIQARAPFEVYYDPANPNVNIVSEPNRRAIKQKIIVAFYAVLFLALLAVLIRKLGALMRISSTANPPATSVG